MLLNSSITNLPHLLPLPSPILTVINEPMISRHFSSFKTTSRISRQCKNLHAIAEACHPLDIIPHPNDIPFRHPAPSSPPKILQFETFKTRLHLGSVDEVTVALALKGCNGDSLLGRRIHGFLVTSGFSSRIMVCNSLMNMYCKSGNFGEALVIFESLNDRDIVSWNTVLSGFEESKDALNFVQRMNFSGVIFDAVTYTKALSFCSRHEEFLFGLQLHSCLMKFGLDGEIFIGNALISMYCRWGHFQEARRVFDEMRIKDWISWNALVSGYSQEGVNGLEGILTFIEMVRLGIKLDHVSFKSVLAACGHEGKLKIGKQVHGLSIKNGYGKHPSVGNVLMSMYARSEVTEDAKLVFQNMDGRDVVSWTTIISVEKGDAVSLFGKMRLAEVYPNDITFIALIHAITVGEMAEQGRMVHGFCIRSGFSSQINVRNSLISMYAKLKSIQDAVKVFQEVNYKEIITWNALISGYEQNGLCREAIQTFSSAVLESKPNQFSFGSVLCAIGAAEDVSLKHGQKCHSQIIKLGLNSDPVVSASLLDMYAKRGSICESQSVFNEAPQRSNLAWTSIISAYARHGDYESVMNWFEEMERQEVRPDSITFLSLLTTCARKGMVDMGRHLFSSMIKDYEIEPSPEHYSCMVDMLGRAGRLREAEELMYSIPGGPGLTVLQSLLGACRIHGNVDLGERVAAALMEMEPTESGSYVLISNLYAEKGQWDMVARIRKEMREKGVKKEVGFSWADIGDVDASLPLHGFSSGDKSHPQFEAIYQMAACVGSEMKFLRERERGGGARQHGLI